MEVIKGRMYDYNNGRFLSVDPIIHGGSQGINPYTYIFNNPLSGIDPTGYAPDLFLQSFLTDRVGHEMAREIVSAGKPTISDETAAVLAVGVLSAILVVVEIADVADTVSDVNLVKKGLKKVIFGDGVKKVLNGAKKALKSGIEGIKSNAKKNGSISDIKSNNSKPKRDPKFKDQVWEQNKKNNGGKANCVDCKIEVEPGKKLNKGDKVSETRGDADHKKALADGGADNAKTNGQLLCNPCHKVKTKKENSKRAKKKREERKKEDERKPK